MTLRIGKAVTESDMSQNQIVTKSNNACTLPSNEDRLRDTGFGISQNLALKAVFTFQPVSAWPDVMYAA